MSKILDANCILCNNNIVVSLFSLENQQQIVSCQQCGLVFTIPWLEEQAIYEEEYFVTKNKYLSRSQEFDVIYSSILTKIQRFKATGKLLDVGCGIGLFLVKARSAGFDVTGVEVSNWAANFARTEFGLTVLTGEIETNLFSAQTFDVIIINHVLEHLSDPVQTLKIFSGWLKRDGILVIGVPNFDSIMSQIKKDRWNSLLPKQHRWHFTPKTLTRMLAQNGFEKVHLSFDNHRNSSPVGKWLVVSILNFLAIILRRGEAMLLIAKKHTSLTT